ncbi:MAG: hypothetical protein IJJ33_18870 [Victivallales bacterium]|nr:hypothetical protein [Victivallales bacterium]
MTNETLDLLECVAQAFLDGIKKYRANGACQCEAAKVKVTPAAAPAPAIEKTKKRGALKMMVAILKESQKPLNKKQLRNAMGTKFAAEVSNGALSQAINTGLKSKVLQRTGRATYTLAEAAPQAADEKA